MGAPSLGASLAPSWALQPPRLCIRHRSAPKAWPLPLLQEGIRSALRARAAAHDALLRDQSSLAEVVQEAAAALEAHAAAAKAQAASGDSDGLAACAAGAQLLTPVAGSAGGNGRSPGGCAASSGASSAPSEDPDGSVAATSSLHGGLGLGLGLGARSPQTAVRALRAAEAEAAAAAQLLQEAWLPSSAGPGDVAHAAATDSAELDRGERAASSKDEEEEAGADGLVEEGEEVEGRPAF